MINKNKLKVKMLEAGLKVEDLARILEVNKSTLYRKLSEKETEFTIGEANKIADFLSLNAEEITTIFFNQNVA